MCQGGGMFSAGEAGLRIRDLQGGLGREAPKKLNPQWIWYGGDPAMLHGGGHTIPVPCDNCLSPGWPRWWDTFTLCLIWGRRTHLLEPRLVEPPWKSRFPPLPSESSLPYREHHPLFMKGASRPPLLSPIIESWFAHFTKANTL